MISRLRTSSPIAGLLFCALSSGGVAIARPPPGQPGAPGAQSADAKDQDPLARAEVAKLNLSKDDEKKQRNELFETFVPPHTSDKTAYDTYGANESIEYLLRSGGGGGSAAWAGNRISLWADLGVGPPEILRLARVLMCLPPLKTGWQPPGAPVFNVDNPQFVATVALCHTDMKKLNKEGVEKDLAADPRFNDLGKAMIRDRFNLVKRNADALLATFEEKAKGDAAWKGIVFDLPEKTEADWEAAYAAHKAEVEAARATVRKILDDVAGRHQVHDIGCGEPTHKALIAYVQSKQAKVAADVLTAVADGPGNYLLFAAGLCDAYEGRFAAARAEQWMMEKVGTRLGPRGAAGFTVFDAVVALELAKKPAPFRRDDVARQNSLGYNDFTHMKEVWWEGKLSLSSEDRDLIIEESKSVAKDHVFNRGVLSASKKGKAGLDLTFKKDSWKKLDWDCVNTTIWGYERDGTPMWRQSCKASKPPFHMENSELAPMQVGSWLATAFKPGQFFQTFTYQRKDDKVNTGFPVAVWSDKNVTKMVMAYGIPLK